jgi:hypothetical protein
MKHKEFDDMVKVLAHVAYVAKHPGRDNPRMSTVNNCWDRLSFEERTAVRMIHQEISP